MLHDWGVAEVKKLLAVSCAALPSGGMLIIHDAFINADKTGPMHVAEYSALLMHSTQGKCYSTAEYADLLRETGFKPGDYHDTGGRARLHDGHEALIDFFRAAKKFTATSSNPYHKRISSPPPPPLSLTARAADPIVVDGPHSCCDGCKNAITKAVAGLRDVSVDEKKGTITAKADKRKQRRRRATS